MWDYDKLFADGNIVGIKNCYRNKIFPNSIDDTTNTAWLNDYKNVFFVPVAATHDSEYNYPYEEVPVNPHSTETFKQYTDCVHPTTAGYYQMADIMFSTIAAHYKDNI